MGVTDDEGAIHLLINLKYTVIVADTGSLILTTPHSTSLVFCENNVRDTQYKTEAATYHYLQQDSAASCISIYFYTAVLVFLIPPQNILKMFPHILGLENIAFVKI